MNPRSNKITRGVIAINSHGWEDFPVHHTGIEANQLLVSWTVLWHPLLLRNSSDIPSWQRLDILPDDPGGLVVVVPKFSRESISENDRRCIQEQGGWLFTGDGDRNQLADQIRQAVELDPQDIDQAVVADFFSLGYCYLQIQLMTRQLRYSSSLDDHLFSRSVMKAVELACRHAPNRIDADYQTAIASCFDLLTEERNRFYPTHAQIVDCLCVTPQTLGRRIRHSLSLSHRQTMYLSGQTADQIACDQELLQTIRDKIRDKQWSLVGGEYYELPTSLISTLSWIRQLDLGRQSLHRFADRSFTYMRQRFGLGTSTPGIVGQFGVKTAVHSTIDDGVFPQTAANNMNWQGDDGSVLQAFVSPPKLATEADTYLKLGIDLCEMIDVSHQASLMLVHWPGEVGPFYQDLIGSCRYGAVLGQLMTIDEYFEQSADSGFNQHYQADDYRDPYLKQMVAEESPNPISRFIDYWQRQVQQMALAGMRAISVACGGQATPVASENQLADLDRILNQGQATEPIDVQQPCHQLAGMLQQKSKQNSPLAINPFGFHRRVVSPEGEWMDVPPMGFATAPQAKPPATGKSQPPLAEEFVLRNEFFEVLIDQQRGGIGAINFYNRRGNLLGQQLAMRKADLRQSRAGHVRAIYSEIALDEIRVTQSTRGIGEIQSVGQMMIGHSAVAEFRQLTRVVRGKPWIEIDVQIKPRELPQGNPWENYFACRFAWGDEAAQLSNYVNESRQPTGRNQISAPLAIEIEQHSGSICIFPGGLPFHQRIGYRRLDSLLSVAGESRQDFKLAIGVDIPYPLATAIDFMCPPLIGGESEMATTGDGNANQGWAFHVNCKNVLPLDWRPLNGSNNLSRKNGRSQACPAGISVLLKETEGREADVTLRCCRKITLAHRVDFVGNQLESLAIESGAVKFPLAGHEIAKLELFW